MNNKSNKSIC